MYKIIVDLSSVRVVEIVYSAMDEKFVRTLVLMFDYFKLLNDLKL